MKTNPPSIEPLEARIAPAILFHFTDVDGDAVTVSISKGNPGDADFVLAAAGPFSAAGGRQLQKIDLKGDPDFAGANITIAAKPADVNGDGVKDGDGLVNLGSIDATGIDLGVVKLPGDLGQLFAGSGSDPARGLTSLSVLSLGRFGMSTGAPGLAVNVDGRLGSLAVKGDLVDTLVIADAIGAVTIGGAVLLGQISSPGDIGLVKIGGDADSGGISTGVVRSTAGKLAGVSIGGSLVRGTIQSAGDMGAIAIRGNADGFIDSGAGRLASLTVGGSYHDFFLRSGVDMGPVKVGRDLNVDITSGGKLASLTVGGEMFERSDVQAAGDIGPVKIARDVAGTIISTGGRLASVTIGGSLGGALNANSAELFSAGDMGPVKIAGSVVGSQTVTGLIHTGGGKIASVSIGGDLRGGSGANSGRIFTTGAIGPVKIGGDLQGSGKFSGSVEGASIASVTVGGSLRGGSGGLSGAIVSPGSIGAIRIGGDLRGISDFGSSAVSIESSGYIEGGRIGSVFIAGSILAGTDGNPNASLIKNASIRSANDIGSITVLGGIIGKSSANGDTDVVISARGGLSSTAKNDVAIGKITVGGRLEHADIFAGYHVDLTPLNADAQVGAVTVGGDWISSNLLVGVQVGGNGAGNADDTKISGAGVKDNADAKGAISRIASVIIKGSALGTLDPNAAAVFGLEAQHIVAIRLGGASVPLTASASNDLFAQRHPLGATFTGGGTAFDFHAFEVL